MGKWYVSYKAGCAMVMKIVPNRANAIEVAYKFLGQNVDVRELGPLSEHRDGNVVSAATLRDLYKASNLANSPLHHRRWCDAATSSEK